MYKFSIGLFFVLFSSSTFAQQAQDPAKLANIYQQQRNAEADGRAQCYAVASEMQTKINELQTKITELEKQLKKE